MIWRGLNKRTSATGIPDGASPDTVNADHAGGKIGLLGARKGKTAFNATGYDAVLKSLIPFRLPYVNQFLLGRTDGTIQVISGPYTESQGEYGNAIRKGLSSTLSLTLTEADENATASVTWADGVPIGANDVVFYPMPTVTVSGRINLGGYFSLPYIWAGADGIGTLMSITVGTGSAGSTMTLTPAEGTWLAIPAASGYYGGVRLGITAEAIEWGDGTNSTITLTGTDYALVYSNA